MALMHGFSFHADYNNSPTALVITLEALARGAEAIEVQLNSCEGL